MADISNIPIGDPTMMAIQLALQAAGQLGSGISNSIKTNYSQNISDPNVSNYIVNTDLFGDRGKSQAINSLQSNLKDFSDIQSKDVLLNTDVDMINRVQDPTVGESLGMFVGDTLSNTAKDPISGTIGQWGNIRRAGKSLGARLGLWDSDADEMNKQIDYINSLNLDNIDNQFNNIEKRERRQAMLNYFAEGGSLEELNGVTKIGAGSTHEQNPNDGVQMGIAPDNLPNLVEEGEVVYKDYVYSNRLKPSKSLLKQYNLPEKYAGKTFAELAEILQKESEDRPNDPISLQTLDDWMSRLTGAQEEYKAKQAERKLAKALDSMSTEQKAAIMSSLDQPMAQEGIDLSQPMYKSGGKIYIKPENRGKFTALKKRTGKSASWFKAHGTPAQKKMATFALNARKWKHENGGHLFAIGGPDKYYPTGLGIDYDYDFPITTITIPDRTDYVENVVPEVPNPYYNWRLSRNLDNKIDVKTPSLVNNTSVPDKLTGKITPKSYEDVLGYNPYPLETLYDDNDNLNPNLSNLRYAPALGAALGALEARLQPKDYTLANQLRDIASKYNPVAAPHIGGYRRYTPYDVNLGDAENLALETSMLRGNRGLNRSTQRALDIATIGKFQEANAKRNLAAQQANEANRLAVDTYNLDIDQFNAQRDTQYDQLNQQILANRINMLGQAAQAADASRTAWANNISSTTENAFNQLGNVGKDNWNRNYTDMLLREYGIDGLAALRQLLS